MVKTDKKHQDYLWNPVVNTFHLDPTNIEEVQSCIKTLNACVHCVLLIFFSPSDSPSKTEKYLLFHLKSPFLRYSNFCNSFSSFPHFPDSKGQMKVE